MPPSGVGGGVTTLLLYSPMQGWAAPLAEVPDAVFSGHMLGDGLALDPSEGVLRAPCDGVVIQAAKHAITVKAPGGAEILMHVGLDTVALDGQGFQVRVREGEQVQSGQTLLEFDLEFLAPRARSLISPIVITNGDAFTIRRRTEGTEVNPACVLMEIAPRETLAGSQAAGPIARREVVVPLAHGLHARPAARLAADAKGFAAASFVICGDRRADARSVSALMALGVRLGDTVAIEAQGADAEQAVARLAQMLVSGLGEQPAAPAGNPVNVPASVQPVARGQLGGVRAAPGLALGVAVRLQAGDIEVAEPGQGIAHETAQLRDGIAALATRLASRSGTQGGDILAAHIALLEDPQIEAVAMGQVSAGKSAGFAFRHAIRAQAAIFKAMAEPRMRERAADLMDLERQLLAILTGKTPAVMSLPERAIVLADELLPSELLALDRARLAGIATSGGGPTSHVAILAVAMGVPALVGLGDALKEISADGEILLDADAGILHLKPDAGAAGAARAKIDAMTQARAKAQATARNDCFTADGQRIEVFANLGSGPEEAAEAVAMGAEGCGLLRTEFLFMAREAPPSEEEQFAQYQGIADALAGRPLILRTFDIGGDKPAPYLPFPREDNPMMGLRGIRAGFHWPELLRTQLAAAARVRPTGQCRIMLPMISSVEEIRKVRALLQELGAASPSLGVMIETPAAALLADHLLAEADFLSIGTNDLTQYVLAMDRGNPLLAGRIDALHPAVLRLIAQVAAAGAATGKPVGLCGGLAADIPAAPLLIGLGVSELSMPPAIIPAAKAAIAAVTLAQCRALAAAALELDSAASVRALLQGAA